MKKIAIIGGGISGLYIANLLRQNLNYEITVYEKNNTINLEKGYGIQLSANSIKLLNKSGFQNVSINEKFFPKKVDFYSLKKRNRDKSRKCKTKRAMQNRIFKDFTPTKIDKDNRRKKIRCSSVDSVIWQKK